MAEYIEREKVYEMLNAIGGCGAEPESWADGWDKAIDTAIDELNEIPAADVRSERHGHWIRPITANIRSYKWQCSECGEISCYVYNGGRYNKNCVCKFLYCPHCGAKIDKEENLMTVKKCDRCGVEVEGSYNLYKGDFILKRHVLFSLKDVDLCKQCTNDLKIWFDEAEESEDK